MSNKQKVLIVDDEPRNQRIVLEVLEDRVEAETAKDGEEALAIAQSYLPDVVLLDIMMPGIDGYEVCRRLKVIPELYLTKVILVSGKAMVEERLKGYECGADDYMTKPFVPEELLAKVKVFLRLTALEKKFAEINHSLEGQVKQRTEALLDTEAKLVNAAKMAALGEMAGGIAHEINTPLGTLGLLGEQIGDLALEVPVERETITEMVRTHGETVRRIGAIITGLRNFSRDGSQDAFSEVYLKKIVTDTLTLCQEKIKHDYIQVTIDVPDDVKIHCRAVQLSQVLLNLVSNACDAISLAPEKWIKIEARPLANRVIISFTDSGYGIPRKIREKVFQPFFTTKDIGKGTGLGLSISKGIIEAHEGEIRIDEQCENTRFLIQIPLKPQRQVA